MFSHDFRSFINKARCRLRSAGCVLVVSLGPLTAKAQDNKAEALETLAMEWISANKAIANEKTQWQEEKASLQRLITLRRRQTDDFKTALSLNPTDATMQTNSQKVAVAEQRLVLETEKVAHLLPTIEKQLESLRSVLPSPLRDALNVHVNAWRKTDASTVERLRSVLGFLRGFEEFQQKISLHEETITLPDGVDYFVKTLYLGTATAYFIDSSGATAGCGYPDKGDWVWEATPNHAKAIAAAVRSVSQNKKDSPLLQLPAQIRSVVTSAASE